MTRVVTIVPTLWPASISPSTTILHQLLPLSILQYIYIYINNCVVCQSLYYTLNNYIGALFFHCYHPWEHNSPNCHHRSEAVVPKTLPAPSAEGLSAETSKMAEYLGTKAVEAANSHKLQSRLDWRNRKKKWIT